MMYPLLLGGAAGGGDGYTPSSLSVCQRFEKARRGGEYQLPVVPLRRRPGPKRSGEGMAFAESEQPGGGDGS